jgi:3-oxoacyl-[acyl-carrier-protein] synthase-3
LTDLWIYQLGVALGSEIVNAAELVEQYGPVRDGFLERTGFATLYRADEAQSGLSLAVNAIKSDATKDDAITPVEEQWWANSVDGLVYVTSTGDLVAPGNSHLLQSALGLKANMLLLDLNDACTGFVKSLQLTSSLLDSGAASTVLLVLSDTYSKLYAPSELKVSPLFSDGASALLVSNYKLTDVPDSVPVRHWKILSSWFLSEGGRASDLSISRAGDDLPLGSLEMNGGGVFNFVLRHLDTCVGSLCRDAGIPLSDVGEWYVHQGSRAVVTAVEKTLGVSTGELFRAGDYGNTVGSSLPFQLFDHRERAGQATTLGLLAFGVGLTMAGMLVQQLPDEDRA